MKKGWRTLVVAALTATMLVTPVLASENKSPRFTTRTEGSAQGYWSDKENLTWTFWGEGYKADGYRNDGESVVIGNGPKYSDLYPEVTDPEYLLKEYVNYPGEGMTNLNSKGEPKANFSEETLQYLKDFVNSFDWIHSDELTRLKAIHNRIACGQSGNTYGDMVIGEPFSVLRYKIGDCQNYAAEFQRLARIVGLECVEYEPQFNHLANMIKINSQWIVVDPTVNASLFDNTETIPVDYEMELVRYPNEQKQRDIEDGTAERWDKWSKLEAQYWQGEITEEELSAAVAELYK